MEEVHDDVFLHGFVERLIQFRDRGGVRLDGTEEGGVGDTRGGSSREGAGGSSAAEGGDGGWWGGTSPAFIEDSENEPVWKSARGAYEETLGDGCGRRDRDVDRLTIDPEGDAAAKDAIGPDSTKGGYLHEI